MQTLSDRQERFIHEYLIDHNASAAAVRAGYSPKTKGTQAAELMKDARVQARIAIEMGELFARLKVSAFELLRKQVCALNFDPAKLFDAQGGAVKIADLDEETKAGLSVSFEERDGERVIKARQTPRHVALAALWRRFDAFQKVQERALAKLVEKEKNEEIREVALMMHEAQLRAIEKGQEEARQARQAQEARASAPRVLPVLDIERPEVRARMRMWRAADGSLQGPGVEMLKALEAQGPGGQAGAQGAGPVAAPDHRFPEEKARDAAQAAAQANGQAALDQAYEAAMEKVRLAEAEEARARAVYEQVRREALAREARES
jgi:phage terminase small subunit